MSLPYVRQPVNLVLLALHHALFLHHRIGAGFSGAMDDWTALAAGLIWAVALGILACVLFMVRPRDA